MGRVVVCETGGGATAPAVQAATNISAAAEVKERLIEGGFVVINYVRHFARSDLALRKRRSVP